MQRIAGLSATDCKPVEAGCGQAMNSNLARAPAGRQPCVTSGYLLSGYEQGDAFGIVVVLLSFIAIPSS
jgi:hypothetical protein